MKILISNDDGIQATGINVLAESISDLGELIIVAPDRNRSGASNSLTLENPIRVSKLKDSYYAVDGTPTDCVHVAITGLLDHEPDMVVSGINAGANLGDDILYSGTVAAAMEGRFLGSPALAISLAGTEFNHFDTAAKVAKTMVQLLLRDPLPADTILNVNVPDLSWDQLRGFAVTRLGHRHKSEPVIKMKDPRGKPFYWIGPPGSEQDAGPGTDFFAINNRSVSVTPIHIDLTQHKTIDVLNEWLKGVESYE